MIEFLRLSAGVAADTVTYLLAWWALPVWALVGAIGLQRLGRAWPLERWARSEVTSRRLAGAFLLAVARPFGRSDVRRNLGRLEGRSGATAVYLTSGHGLTLYYLALLGPLLGKDVLLSHVAGMLVFAALATALAVLFQAAGASAPDVKPDRGSSGPGEATAAAAAADATEADGAVAAPGADGAVGVGGGPGGWRSLLVGEGGRFLGWSLWGLAVGGLVGAAGLASPGLHLVDLLPGEGLVRQVVHGAAGLLAAPASLMGPVATLFAGTFLWKVGLAHAGLVAFFCAATLSPQRVRLYREVWGGGRTTRWVLALAVAALAAGLVVALLFGFTGLEIRYKLVPAQLWHP